MVKVKTMWELRACSEPDLMSLFKGLDMGVFNFKQKETEAENAVMETTQQVSVSFVMYKRYVSLFNSTASYRLLRYFMLRQTYVKPLLNFGMVRLCVR